MNNKNVPLVSLIILNFNGIEYLEETIPAILNLNYPNIEYIVVDNGSTDDSIDFIKKYPQIKIIKNIENLGYSIGKNTGLKAAKGAYILSLDEDILINDYSLLQKLICKYSDNTCFLQVPLIDRGKEKTFYYGTFYSIYGLNMHRQSVSINMLQNFNKKIEICGPTGGFFFVSKINLQKIGYFDESQKFHIDDVDIGPRSCIFGFKNFLITDIYCEHLGINKTANLEKFINRYKLVFSGHARAMFKNFKMINLLIRFPVFLFFQLLKAIKFSVIKKSIKVFYSFFISVSFFIKNLADTLRQRKIIQSKRIISKDIFLKINTPKFNLK